MFSAIKPSLDRSIDCTNYLLLSNVNNSGVTMKSLSLLFFMIAFQDKLTMLCE